MCKKEEASDRGEGGVSTILKATIQQTLLLFTVSSTGANHFLQQRAGARDKKSLFLHKLIKQTPLRK